MMKYFGCVVVSLAMLAAGCKKDDPVSPPTIPTSTTYVGTFEGTGETGSIALTQTTGKISDPSVASGGISGLLNLFGGGTITLSGTLTNNTFVISGGGYTFTGTISGGSITGTYTGPNGPGGFSAQIPVAGTTSEVYIGTYTSLAGQGSGRLNTVISGTSMWGVVVSDDGSRTEIIGVVNGNSMSVRAASAPAVELATGTKSGNTWSGTYNGGTDNGTWTATLLQ